MLTIFCATHNRLDTLTRSLLSYRRQKYPYEVVLIDNGTDHPRCLDLLDELERWPEVRKIYHLPPIRSMAELTDNYNVALTDQFDSGRRGWYAVTDADVCFDGSSAGSFGAYVRLARHSDFGVGPHLRARDIPHGYPLRSRVLATEARIMERSTMQWWQLVPHNLWSIDTTFHVFASRRDHPRLHMNCYRVGPPFDAQHLDWYVDVDAPTEENRIYILDPGNIGSWGRTWIASFWRTYMDESPEAALAELLAQPHNESDLCNRNFILSWCYQYGRGCEPNIAASQHLLRSAIPGRFTHFLTTQPCWQQMIYEDDFACLGWPQ